MQTKTWTRTAEAALVVLGIAALIGLLPKVSGRAIVWTFWLNFVFEIVNPFLAKRMGYAGALTVCLIMVLTGSAFILGGGL